MRFRKFLLLIALFALGGCTSLGTQSYTKFCDNQTPLKEDTGRVFIIRQPNYYCALVSLPLTVDDRMVCKCPNGSFFFIDLPPGEYKIATAANRHENDAELYLNLEAKKVKYVVTGIGMIDSEVEEALDDLLWRCELGLFLSFRCIFQHMDNNSIPDGITLRLIDEGDAVALMSELKYKPLK